MFFPACNFASCSAGVPPVAISHRIQRTRLACRQGQFRIAFSELGFAEFDVGKCWTDSLRKNAQQWDKTATLNKPISSAFLLSLTFLYTAGG
jgi:hypothetical protein